MLAKSPVKRSLKFDLETSSSKAPKISKMGDAEPNAPVPVFDFAEAEGSLKKIANALTTIRNVKDFKIRINQYLVLEHCPNPDYYCMLIIRAYYARKINGMDDTKPLLYKKAAAPVPLGLSGPTATFSLEDFYEAHSEVHNLPIEVVKTVLQQAGNLKTYFIE